MASSANWRQQQRPVSPRALQRSFLKPSEVKCGLMAYFALRNVPSSSVIHADQFVNEGASGHPVLIVGQQKAGAILICCLTTSLGSRSIQAKFPGRTNPARWMYLAINHQDRTQAHNNLPVLELANGRSTDKQSYICLTAFFRIETRYLEHFRSGDIHLDEDSVDIFQAIFRTTLAERIPRNQGYRISSPLDLRSWILQELGVPAGPFWTPGQQQPRKADPGVCWPLPRRTGNLATNGCPWVTGPTQGWIAAVPAC